MKLLTACFKCDRIFLIHPMSLANCPICKTVPLRSITLEYKMLKG